MLPSLYVPKAVNCRDVPAAIERLDGETAMDFNVAEVTVRVTTGLVTPPMAAVICVDPAASPRTEPAPTLAIPGFEEFQSALPVTFCAVPSLKVPVATSGTVPFFATDAVVGVTAIDRSVAEVTLSVTAELVTPPNDALICVVPVAWPRARAFPEPMVATAVFEEAQVTVEETSCVVSSLKVPMAVNCCVPLGATEAVPGVTAIDFSAALVTVRGTAGLTMPVCVELDAAGPKTMGEPGA